MVVGISSGGKQSQSDAAKPDTGSPNGGETFGSGQTHLRRSEEIDSSSSTPYVSAPSSPGRVPNGYYFSAPTSPLHFMVSASTSSSSSSASASDFASSSDDPSVSGSLEFEFSARFPSNSSASTASMISADELFHNGQILPMKLSSHSRRPQIPAPLLDLESDENCEDSQTRERESRLPNKSPHRRVRSVSPMRNLLFEWREDEEERETSDCVLHLEDPDGKQDETPSMGTTTPSMSASSSGKNPKRWIFLKDLLYRSKSEGRGTVKGKFRYSLSFSPAIKDKKPPSTSLPLSSSNSKERKPPLPSVPTTETQKPKRTPANGVSKRRIPPSAHELHYTTNRAQTEELKKKTFLPYRQGLLGFLGFNSKSYGAVNGFARTPVSSR